MARADRAAAAVHPAAARADHKADHKEAAVKEAAVRVAARKADPMDQPVARVVNPVAQRAVLPVPAAARAAAVLPVRM